MVGPYISERCVEHGVILRNIENNMAFCPPLIITEPQIDDLFDRFEQALDDTHKWVKRG
jgi:4-aminobutyrate--pyruvate transaminase